jgi:NAD-dependent deacetylase
MIRPDVTLYEENLPETAWSNAIYALSNADLLIIGGTSLSVWPAAGMIQYAHCPTVLINKGVVDAKVVTDIDFKEGLGEVFSKIKTDYEV